MQDNDEKWKQIIRTYRWLSDILSSFIAENDLEFFIENITDLSKKADKDNPTLFKYIFTLVFNCYLSEDKLPDFKNTNYTIMVWQFEMHDITKETKKKPNQERNILEDFKCKLIRLLQEYSSGYRTLLDPPEKLKGDFFFAEIYSNGKAVDKNLKYDLPFLNIRRKLCKSFYKLILLSNELRTNFLFQREKNQDYWAPSSIGIPYHIGWAGNMDGYLYSAHWTQKEKSDINFVALQNMLKQIPITTFYTLFGYLLFSVIKFFMPGYPARINQNDSWKKVSRQKEKLIFLNVQGEGAEKAISCFYGFFQTLTEQQEKMEKLKNEITELNGQANERQARLIREQNKMIKQQENRIHDGVKIYPHGKKQKLSSLSKWVNSLLIQDAALVCQEAIFKHSPQQIQLYINHETADVLDQYSFDFENLIRSWTEWLEFVWQLMQKAHLELCCQKLTNAYQAQYQEYRKCFQQPPSPCPPWLTISFIEAITRKELKFNTKKCASWKYLSLKIQIFAHKALNKFNLENESEKELLRFQNTLLKIVNDEKRSFLMNPFNLQIFARNQAIPLKYQYLSAAVELFCRYLDDISKGDSFPYREVTEDIQNTLRNAVPDIWFEMEDVRNPTTEDPWEWFGKYLSEQILAKKIIPVRSADGIFTGWYDGKKQYLYLPYKTYFKNLTQAWTDMYHVSFPYTQSGFQSNVLMQKGALEGKVNRQNSEYLRPECRIKVAPATKAHLPAETVIKLHSDVLPLTDEARQQLELWNQDSSRRRAKSE